jgi:hypothetical protein
MMLLMLLGCPDPADKADDTGVADTDTDVDPEDWTPSDPASNLCVTIAGPAEAGTSGIGAIATVLEGETACVGGDTGGSGWWDETVETNIPYAASHLEYTLDPGTYGVEISALGMYSGCGGVEITGTGTCEHELLIELGYEVPVDKPNVYLYPEAPTKVAVTIPAWKKITESEPRYPVDGWRVTAYPDGRLATKAGPRDYLFYELMFDAGRFQTEDGWCVPGATAQASIEDAMADMGFLPNEITDFADAWDPIFPAAAWMTVYPQVDDLSALRIDPAPDHLLRAWFLVAEGCDAVVAPQIAPVPRTGFHAAEWGIAFRAPLDRGEILVEGWR